MISFARAKNTTPSAYSGIIFVPTQQLSTQSDQAPTFSGIVKNYKINNVDPTIPIHFSGVPFNELENTNFTNVYYE